MLDDLGLGPALEWQAREFSRRHGVPVTVQLEGALDCLPDGHRTCIYRVVQEALTNIARHAEASEIRVSLHGARDRAFLTVQDNGVGFDFDSRHSRGLGLLGIQERVRELGGAVTWTSQPGRGTMLSAEIPVPQSQQTGRETAVYE
jgi:signal transduction histidine kinase